MKAVFVPSVVALALAALLALPAVAQPDDPPADPPGSPPPSLELTLEAGAAVIDQVTPGEPVALVFLGRGLRGFGAKSLFGALWLPDDDGDGTVRFELEPGVDRASAWVAVDLATGRTASATPEGFEPRTRPIPDTALEKAEDGLVRGLRRGGRYAWAALVRPGDADTRGLWKAFLEDGHAADGDTAVDGSVLFLPELAEPVDVSPPAPETLQGGDVIVLLDPRTVELSLLEIRDVGPPDEEPTGDDGEDEEAE